MWPFVLSVVVPFILQNDYRDGIRKDKNEHVARQHLPSQRRFYALMGARYFGVLATWSMPLGSRVPTWDPTSKLRLQHHHG
jgi:hypothetical protein